MDASIKNLSVMDVSKCTAQQFCHVGLHALQSCEGNINHKENLGGKEYWSNCVCIPLLENNY